MKDILLTLLFSFLFGLSLQAQPSVSLPDITVDESQAFNLEVRVDSFVNVVTMQYTISWDVSKIEFVDIINYNLPDMDSSDFGNAAVNTDQGLLPLAWLAPTLNGVTVEDSTAIFTLRMKAKGTPGDVVPFEFVNMPTMIEVAVNVNGNLESVSSNLVQGQVTLEDLVAVEDLKKETLKLYHSYPNPFNENTTLQFELAETTETTLTIFDLAGNEIYRKEERRSAGFHQVEIDSSIFPTSGEYFYSLRTTDNQLLEKLIFIR